MSRCAYLPDDEGASVLQQLPLQTEALQQVDHELVKVGVHAGGGGRRVCRTGKKADMAQVIISNSVMPIPQMPM